jgi:hypothetical protein
VVVEADDIKPGPIRHATLPDWFLIRSQLVSHVLGDSILSLHDLIENFQRDADPEKELQIFERMAAAYLLLTAGRPVKPEIRQDLVGDLLTVSMLPASDVNTFDAKLRPVAAAYYNASAPGRAELVNP